MTSVKRLGNNQNKTDEDLIRAFCSSGDLDVLGDLYSRYMHLVYGVCLKYLQNREEAKDAVMQIFEKLITDIPKQEIKTFRSWLHVVAKNYCLMQLRSEKSHVEKLEEWSADKQKFMEYADELHPIDRDETNREEALKECIEKLKEEQKLCIRLFYYEDKCYREIADELDINEKKVKSHLQNAKRNLKICLDNQNEK